MKWVDVTTQSILGACAVASVVATWCATINQFIDGDDWVACGFYFMVATSLTWLTVIIVTETYITWKNTQ